MKTEIIAKVRETSAKYKITPIFSQECQGTLVVVDKVEASGSKAELHVLQNHLDRLFLQDIRNLKHLA